MITSEPNPQAACFFCGRRVHRTHFTWYGETGAISLHFYCALALAHRMIRGVKSFLNHREAASL